MCSVDLTQTDIVLLKIIISLKLQKCHNQLYQIHGHGLILTFLKVVFSFLLFFAFSGLRKDYKLLNENLIFEGAGNGSLQLKIR